MDHASAPLLMIGTCRTPIQWGEQTLCCVSSVYRLYIVRGLVYKSCC